MNSTTAVYITVVDTTLDKFSDHTRRVTYKRKISLLRLKIILEVKRAVGIYIRIPMYSVMGGAPVGCSPRIKGGVPGRAIVKFLHFCIMAVECRFGRAAFFFFSSALC